MITIEKKIEIEKMKYLVVEGGGGRGCAYVGFIQALEEYIDKKAIITEDNPLFKGIAGTSAGAITALLIALGLNSEEITKKSKEFIDFFNDDMPNCTNYRGVKIEKVLDKLFKDDLLLGSEGNNISQSPSNDLIENHVDNIKVKIGYFRDGIITKEIITNNPKIDKYKTAKEVENHYKKYYDFKKNLSNIKMREKKEKHVIPQKISTFPKKNKLLFFRNIARPIFLGLRLYIKRFAGSKVPFVEDLPEDEQMDIINRINKDIDSYLYNILFDKGLLSGNKVRECYTAIIDSSLKEKFPENKKVVSAKKEDKSLGQISFEEFQEITNVDLRVISSNITFGERVVFSAKNTPDFPVAEAVAMSMNIPGAFKPIFVENEEDYDNTKNKRNKLKSGFYGDGGMLDNFSIDVFGKENVKYTMGVYVTSGPNPDENISCSEPEFTKEENSDYQKYLKGYWEKYDKDLPNIVEMEKCMVAGKSPNGFSLLSYVGQILNMFLTYSTKKRFERDDLKDLNIIEVFSYNFGIFDFSPKGAHEEHLFNYVVKKSKEITENKIN